MDQLLERFDEDSLGELQRPKGKRLVRVGTAAASILRNARALASGQEILLSKPEIPESKNYVMFDLEGLPPQLDELQKVYLWGMQVFGEIPGPYTSSTAGFGVEGDRQGWEEFLTKASEIFDIYGDILFVHWATYEATLIDLYLKRFGDDTGRAARVQKNLLNLLPITEQSIVLPLPGYSLKVIEKYVGFKRTQNEYGGNWSMAKYIEATETEDEAMREEVMDAIRIYNREDLEATWAVMQWLLKQKVGCVGISV
jgi:predicted RecB family nuclease